MLRAVIFLAAICLASTMPTFGAGYLEKKLTNMLRSGLKLYHPFIIPNVTGINIKTHLTSVVVSAQNTVVVGFDDVYVTRFLPPVPLISNVVELEAMVENLYLTSDAYTLYGTHRGQRTNTRGAGEILMENLSVKVFFKTQNYNLFPMSLCIMKESLVIGLKVGRVFARLEGAGSINDDIDINGPNSLEVLEEELNKRSRARGHHKHGHLQGLAYWTYPSLLTHLIICCIFFTIRLLHNNFFN